MRSAGSAAAHSAGEGTCMLHDRDWEAAADDDWDWEAAADDCWASAFARAAAKRPFNAESA